MQLHLQRQHVSIKMLYGQEQPLFYSSAVWKVSGSEAVRVCRLSEGSRSSRKKTEQGWQCGASQNGAELVLHFSYPAKHGGNFMP